MKVVGELFGSGQMQLPFVLQSAETMKSTVDYLNPYLTKQVKDTDTTLVIGTVRGDVHDVGKNLVDIILSNNGFKVVNVKNRLARVPRCGRTPVHSSHRYVRAFGKVHSCNEGQLRSHG